MWSARSRDKASSDIVATSLPAIVTVPDVGRSSVPMMLSIVDLPDPEGPTTATSSPAATSSETPRSAPTSPYVFTTSSSDRTT